MFICASILISPYKIILNERFLVVKTQDLLCHELIFCKWVNLQKHY